LGNKKGGDKSGGGGELKLELNYKICNFE